MKSPAWSLIETAAGEFWLVPCKEETVLLDGVLTPVDHFMLDKRAKRPLLIKQIWHQGKEGEPLPATLPVKPNVIKIAVEWMEEVAL